MAGDTTEADAISKLFPARYVLLAAMDSDTRGAWRLVSRHACMSVYEVTYSLRWRAREQSRLALAEKLHGTPAPPAPRALPTTLFAKLPGLRRLEVSDMPSLESLVGVTSSLDALHCDRLHTARTQAPLSCLHPCLRELSLHAVRCCGREVSSLRACTSLVKLDLADCFLGKDLGSAHGVAAVVRCLTLLQHLNLARNDLRGLAAALAPSLALLPDLRHLDLADNDMRAEAMGRLGSAIQALSRLTHLHVGHNQLGAGGDGSGAAALGPALVALTSLRELDLAGNELEAVGLSVLAPALRQLPLWRLGFNSNLRRDTGGAAQLAPLLDALPGLQSLDIGQNAMGDDGAVALAPTLGRLTALTALVLSNNAIGADGFVALAPALLHLTRLRELHVGGNDPGPEGLRALAPALRALGGASGLRVLQCGDMCVGRAEGAAALASGLSALVALTRLDLRGLESDADAVAALAPALAQLPNLQDLSFAACWLGADGMAAVSPALGGLESLTKLDVTCNGFAAEGAAALALALERLTALRELVLGDGNFLGQKGCDALVPAIKGLGRLEVLDFVEEDEGGAWQQAGLYARAPAAVACVYENFR